jgi:hypothetical protein
MDILPFIVQLLSAFAAVLKVLEHFGISLKKRPNMASESLPQRRKMAVLTTAGIFLFLSLASASYGFYVAARRPMRIVSCGFSFTEKPITPRDSTWSYGLSVTITPDHEREHAQLLIISDGPIGAGPRKDTVATLAQGGSFTVQAGEPMQSHPEVWNVKWANPTWNVNDPVTFELFSERPIRVKWVFPIIYNPGS